MSCSSSDLLPEKEEIINAVLELIERVRKGETAKVVIKSIQCFEGMNGPDDMSFYQPFSAKSKVGPMYCKDIASFATSVAAQKGLRGIIISVEDVRFLLYSHRSSSPSPRSSSSCTERSYDPERSTESVCTCGFFDSGNSSAFQDPGEVIEGLEEKVHNLILCLEDTEEEAKRTIECLEARNISQREQLSCMLGVVNDLNERIEADKGKVEKEFRAQEKYYEGKLQSLQAKLEKFRSQREGSISTQPSRSSSPALLAPTHQYSKRNGVVVPVEVHEKVDELERKLVSLTAENGKLEHGLTVLKKKHDETLTALETSKKKCEGLQNKVASMEETNHKFSELRKQATAFNGTLMQDYADINAAKKALEADLQKADAEKEALVQQLAENDNIITYWKRQYNHLKKENTDLKADFDTLYSEKTRVEQEVKELKQKNANMEGADKKLFAESETLKAQLASTTDELKKSQKEKQECSDANTVYALRIETLQQEKSKLKDELGTAEQRISHLEQTLGQMQEDRFNFSPITSKESLPEKGYTPPPPPMKVIKDSDEDTKTSPAAASRKNDPKTPTTKKYRQIGTRELKSLGIMPQKPGTDTDVNSEDVQSGVDSEQQDQSTTITPQPMKAPLSVMQRMVTSGLKA